MTRIVPVKKNKNGKTFWDTVKPYFTNKSCHTNHNISLLEKNQVVSDPSCVSDIFNSYFVSVANDISEPAFVQDLTLSELIAHYNDHNSIKLIKENVNKNSTFSFKTVNCEVVRAKIKALKTNKACGHDKLPARLLKCVNEELSESYTHVINSCINDGVFPQSLKDAEVNPIFKKHDTLLKENYRPVSVLTATSKIYESIMCDQLLDFFKNKLSNTLAGFRKGFSCETVLLRCVENWKQALDKNECVGCIMMDLSKAFDSLPHGLLIAKLYAYGLSENACKLVKDYLSNRRQRVKVSNICSDWQEIQRGVPQGSLAGPLLFNIFINDFIYVLEHKCDVFNYADDNNLSFHHNDPQMIKSVLEDAAKVAIKWFAENKMKANPSKFQAILLCRKPVSMSFHIGDAEIMPTNCVKLLGVHIDDKLSFAEHVTYLCKKTAKQLNAMSRLRNILNKETKHNIFNSFIVSNFNYCPLVYHVCGIGSTSKMERILQRGVRLIYNDFVSDINALMANVNVSSLFITRLRLLAVHVYKIVHNMSPQYNQCNMYEVKNVPYNLRSNICLVQPTFGTKTYGFNSLLYLGAKLWNMLPNVCKALPFNDFKSYIQQWDGPICCGQCHLCFTLVKH